jgi:cytochrome P450
VLDAVAEFSRVIPIALLRDYFGVPGPDPGTMQRWMRYLFWDIFLNQGDDATVRAKSSACSAEFKAYVASLIRERKAQVSRGRAGRLRHAHAAPASATDLPSTTTSFAATWAASS